MDWGVPSIIGSVEACPDTNDSGVSHFEGGVTSTLGLVAALPDTQVQEVSLVEWE